MAKLFERFVLNFYRIERPDLNVRRENIAWDVSSGDAFALKYLLSMQTDISIRSPGCTLIIDAKYYRDMFDRNYDKESFKSAHINQIFAYVKNVAARGGTDAYARGMLLYPAVEKATRSRFEMHGHQFMVCTIDLAQPWSEVRKEMMELLNFALAQCGDSQ